MATQLSDSGHVIRDEAEAVGEAIACVKSILVEALVEAPLEPRDWAQYIGRALKAAGEAEEANEVVKQIIYQNRRRS